MADDFNLVRITGASADLRATGDVDGLLLHDHGTRPLGGDSYSVAANATDAAIAVLRQRGLQVDIVYSAADMATHFAALDAETGSGSTGNS
jgi:hypothetical protein